MNYFTHITAPFLEIELHFLKNMALDTSFIWKVFVPTLKYFPVTSIRVKSYKNAIILQIFFNKTKIITSHVTLRSFCNSLSIERLMGEEFIFLTRGYGFMGGVSSPFWHVRKMYFYLWYELETLQVVRLAFLKNFETMSFIVRRRETSMTS